MIPAWLTEKLAHPPTAGAGVHAWLFSTARQLHAHMDPAGVTATLTAAVSACGRRVTEREIRDAVQNSRAVAWTRKTAEEAGGGRDTGSGRPVPAAGLSRWPDTNENARRCRIADAAADGVAGVADLWERSPSRPEEETADDWLDWLFPGAEWLCLARDHPATARTRLRERWSFGPADECGLVVPSPMTAPSGKGLDGRTSHRCLANTGPRRWLVIEFDRGSMDDQAALHWHLREAAQAMGWPRLALAVSSGGKSLHGWYGVCENEETSRSLMEYAVRLGADPATWNRCQLVRLPEGKRGAREPATVELPDGWPVPAEVRQRVIFFDPQSLWHPSTTNFIRPSASSVSMPVLGMMAA